MGFLDFILGRKEQSPENLSRRESAPRAPQRTDDEIAVERYQYLLRTAPPETIEQVHTEAFSKLTDEQRDLLFRQLTETVAPSERPKDAQPASLAKAATRAELREPGTLTRSFGDQGGQGGQRGMGMGSMIGGSLLGTVAGFVIGSALVSAFMPMDGGGADAASEGDAGSDAGADGGDAGGDAGGDFGGGDFGGGGGDFGGGDFGGGFDF
ncbi:hypothetical protein D6T64_07720 [Cryobacterium melibiosiphilum]|uniref:DUF2076 domain-containing protein n=1 Tax=Cryobacterium melibiosiphilum TaxID=995039 RepID=A0A3A5MVC4_9MICO|nr:hypothetical protein [Cryobacterium melibiosiphilum]RJT89144.1 hypothetical protein D6T64_07720 [Cryobacterium melibiosiphilum]